MRPLHALRRRLGMALRTAVAGPESGAVGEHIWGTPGPRLFTPADPVWRVHDDASMFVGGIRALLVQSLHPVAMQAVAEHSDYAHDTWGRVARTSTFIATTTFGTVDHALNAIRVVRSVHDHITGVTDDGQPYSANDPDLLLWVHCAEIDSFLTTYQLFGSAPLSVADADAYVLHASYAAWALGAHRLPTTVAELQERLAEFTPTLAATPAAVNVAHFLLHRPPVQGLARLGYDVLARAAVASLPDHLAAVLGLTRSPWRRRLDQRLGRVGVAAIRWMLNDPEVSRHKRTMPTPA